MPRTVKPLKDTAIKNCKPGIKDKKYSDGDGLYLLVTSKGGKYWRMKYRLHGKEHLLALGTYPEIQLADARMLRDDARRLVAKGIDPNEVKKARKDSNLVNAENSFEVITREWHTKFFVNKSESHRVRTLRSFERDVFPWIGNRPIADIKAPELLKTLQRIESRGALETAHRTRSACGQVFRYAIATGRAERDWAADLVGALPPYKSENLAALTEPAQVAQLLRVIETFECSFVVKSALYMSPYVFVRPGNLRKAEWSEINFACKRWEIPALKMKMKKDFIVPLSRQVIEILKDLKPLTGGGKYVFPCHRTTLKPMSENAILAALRRMGYSKDEMTGHGFRAMARTMIRERLKEDPEYIEIQLAHVTKNANGTAYDRVAFIDERTEMMQQWADYLDKLKAGEVGN